MGSDERAFGDGLIEAFASREPSVNAIAAARRLAFALLVLEKANTKHG